MRNKILLTTISFLISTFTFSQHYFTTDYKAIKELTTDLKTYSIEARGEGKSIKYPMQGHKNEIAEAFDFLKDKKLVNKNPDFTIYLNFDGFETNDPTYVQLRTQRFDTYNSVVYQIHTLDYINISLIVVTNNNSNYSIELANHKKVENVFEQTIKEKGYISSSDLNNVNTRLPQYDNIDSYIFKFKSDKIKLFPRSFVNNFDSELIRYKKNGLLL